MLYYDWHYTLADNDLRKVETMSELAGVRVSYPMLHRESIDMSLQRAGGAEDPGRKLRSLLQACDGRLPSRADHSQAEAGFGLPFGLWLQETRSCARLILGHLESLRTRHIVRSEFIDSLIKRHRDGDASFYGYPIWDMAMLDAWLTAHDIKA